MISLSHSGCAGDIIYALPCIQGLVEKIGSPVDLYLRIDSPANFYTGAVHPCGNVLMNRAVAQSLIPLLSAQPGISTVAIWKDEAIDIDLDLFRKCGINFVTGHLPRWYFYAFDSWYDLSSPYLWVTPRKGIGERLVVNRTSRYRNPAISYSFLEPYSPIFVGHRDEFLAFRAEVDSAEWLETPSCWELASIIAGCKAFCGNQSLAYSIAEALKVPRCLEVCPFAATVSPVGGQARDAFNQSGFESNVLELLSLRSSSGVGALGVVPPRPKNLRCQCGAETAFFKMPEHGYQCPACEGYYGLCYRSKS